jgi:hypothetical protein
MFKERFGGTLVQGYLWKFGYRPVKYFLYNLAARWRRGGDIVDQERHKLTDGSGPVFHRTDEGSTITGACDWPRVGPGHSAA